jgi:hypothetical protein
MIAEAYRKAKASEIYKRPEALTEDAPAFCYGSLLLYARKFRCHRYF